MAVEQTNEPHGGLLAQAQHYWHSVLKWKWTAGLFFLTALSIATIYSFVVPPVYSSKGSVWIEEGAKILPFDDIQTPSAGSDLQSHTQLLKSRTLAADTINKLKLYENSDFAGKSKKGRKPQDPEDPVFREGLIQKFQKSLIVTSVERTRLVSVQFSNRNPRLAADILNALFDGYVEMIVRKKFSASEKASEFLSAQITGLRTEIESREKELNRYGSERDILPLTAAEAPMVTRIAALNKALTDATIDKVNKLNYYNQLKAAPLGEVPGSPENSLIQRLREQYITLSRQYATRLATVRPEYPEMQRLRTELDSATEALQNETQNLIRNAYNDYEAALRNEQSLQKMLNDQKNEAFKSNSNSINYNSLRIELENRKALLESLAKRQSETDVSSQLKGLEALNVWIVDKADYPLKPAFPDKRKNVLLGFLFGLVGGIGLALGFEYLNHTVKTSKDVVNTVGLPSLGSVPAFEAAARLQGLHGEFAKIRSMFAGKGEKNEEERQKKDRQWSIRKFWARAFSARDGSKKWEKVIRDFMARIIPDQQANGPSQTPRIELIASREPQSIQAESYRSIRTTLLVSSVPGKIKTILFTSPLAREGKSSTLSNLGITLVEANKKVVIVDADLRKPKQAKLFGTADGRGAGLSTYLSTHMEPKEAIRPSDIPGLHLITSGPLPTNPIELLSLERMDALVVYLKKNFDFVLIDTPPILAVSDAIALGPMVDAIILVARGGQTPIPAIKQAKQKLAAHRLKCLGVILNDVDLFEQDGYYAKQYYRYSKAD